MSRRTGHIEFRVPPSILDGLSSFMFEGPLDDRFEIVVKPKMVTRIVIVMRSGCPKHKSADYMMQKLMSFNQMPGTASYVQYREAEGDQQTDKRRLTFIPDRELFQFLKEYTKDDRDRSLKLGITHCKIRFERTERPEDTE